VHDFVTGPALENPGATMFSLVMLVWTESGKAYAEDDYVAWMHEADLTRPSAHPLPGMRVAPGLPNGEPCGSSRVGDAAMGFHRCFVGGCVVCVLAWGCGGRSELNDPDEPNAPPEASSPIGFPARAADASVGGGADASIDAAADAADDHESDTLISTMDASDAAPWRTYDAQPWIADGSCTWGLGAAKSYAAGSDAVAVALGDINGDALLDIAVANDTSNTVSVLLGNGDGTFQAQQQYATGRGPDAMLPISIAIGDLDGDGTPDIVVGTFEYSDVSLFWNARGKLSTPVLVPAGGSSPESSVALGDMNGDGRPDFVTADFSTVSVVLNAGNETFQAPIKYPAGSAANPSSVAVADLNGDGKLDVAMAVWGYALGLQVFLGNGDGTLQTQQSHAAGVYPHGVAVGDLNADGKPDVVVANEDSATVSVLLGNGDGTFQSQVAYSSGGGAEAVTIADLNGDGKPDLAVAADESLSVLLGNGDGTFPPPLSFVAGGSVSVVVGDLTRDGIPDVVVANSLMNEVSVFLGMCGP
jgi:hypothetical protein